MILLRATEKYNFMDLIKSLETKNKNQIPIFSKLWQLKVRLVFDSHLLDEQQSKLMESQVVVECLDWKHEHSETEEKSVEGSESTETQNKNYQIVLLLKDESCLDQEQDTFNSLQVLQLNDAKSHSHLWHCSVSANCHRRRTSTCSSGHFCVESNTFFSRPQNCYVRNDTTKGLCHNNQRMLSLSQKQMNQPFESVMLLNRPKNNLKTLWSTIWKMLVIPILK